MTVAPLHGRHPHRVGDDLIDLDPRPVIDPVERQNLWRTLWLVIVCITLLMGTWLAH